MTAAPVLAACPICGEGAERRFVLHRAPLLQNVLYDDRASALAAESAGDCPFHHCRDCHVAFNPEFAAGRIGYDERYDNDQCESQTYRRYLDDIARHLIEEYGLTSGSRVLEIGCGNGYLISRIREGSGAQVLGFDPAWSGRYGSSRFIRREMFAPPADFSADLVILRHCLEALTEPDTVFGDLARVLHASSRVYIECTSLDYILDRTDFSLLYHEYARYYSVGGLCRQLGAREYSLETSRALFDGQYFGCVFRPTPGWNDLQDAAARLRKALVEHAPTLLWGTSGRTVTVLSHLDLDESTVAACVDIASFKQGRYVPVTGQKILSPAQARAYRPRRVVVVNDNYLSEVAAELPADTELLSLSELICRGDRRTRSR